MGYKLEANSDVPLLIKSSYAKLVIPFEEWVIRIKAQGGAAPPDPTILTDTPKTPKESNGAESLATPSSEMSGPFARAEGAEMGEKVHAASSRLHEALGTGVG